MNIGSIIQKHYHRSSTLFSSLPIEFSRHIFTTLAVTGIVHGTRLNPLSNYYQFNVCWDGNTARLDGPYGAKLTRLDAKITLQPSSWIGANASKQRDGTTLRLSIHIPIADINRNLIVMALVYAYLFCLIPNPIFKLLSFVAYWLGMYGLTWLSVTSSTNIIRESLLREFGKFDANK